MKKTIAAPPPAFLRSTPVNSRKNNNLWRMISSILILLCAFFTPWGAGLQQVVSFDLSKIFVYFMVLLILYYLLYISFISYEGLSFPSYFNYYILFVILHTFISYVFIFPEELKFGYTGMVNMQHGFIRLQEAVGIGIARFFLFILFAYSLASLLKNEKQFILLCLAYGAGLAIIIVLGGYVAVAGSKGGRLSGGVLDPNAFGMSAAIAVFLNMFVWTTQNTKVLYKFLSIIFVGFGVIGIFSSGSRGAILGVVIGLLIILMYTPISIKEKGKLAPIVLVGGVTILFFIPRYARQSLSYRLDIQRIQQTRGSNRLDIWTDYLGVFHRYALTGVGLKRSREVIKDTWTSEWGVPHNNYLEVLVEYGLVGLILFIMGLMSLWKRVSYKLKLERKKISNAVILGLFSAWLTISFFLSNLAIRDTWLMLGTIAAYGSLGNKRLVKRNNTKFILAQQECKSKKSLDMVSVSKGI